jgi:epoxide hydrolase-like predicted phosphatase
VTSHDVDGNETAPEGLVVDWGGVLTKPLRDAFTAWAAADGVDYEHYRDVLAQWQDLAAAESGAGGPVAPVHALERGEMPAAEFEQLLADELHARGSRVTATGLLGRMLAGLEEPETRMHALVRRAREAGVRTALLSNSWGNTYDRRGWEEMFDVVVISGEVGMRKPEARIFEHTASLLGLSTSACVMVDDLPWNIDGARSVGMEAVLHRDVDDTARELEALLGVPLAPPPA